MSGTTRRSLLALVGALPIFRPARAAGPASFTLVPALQAGQRVAYHLAQRVMRNGHVAVHTRSRVSLHIVARADDGWQARWLTHESRVVEAPAALRPVFETMAALWADVPVEVRLDADGRVASLAGIEGLRRQLQAAVDRVLPQLPDMNEAVATLTRRMLQPVMDSDACIAQALLKEVSILMGAMGREFAVGRPLQVAGSVPSPLGSGEIPTLGRFELRAVDSARGEADIGWLLAVDDRRLSRLLAEELAAIGVAATVAGRSPLDFADRGDYVVDLRTAWPLRIRHERRASSVLTSREDLVEFTRIAP